LTKIAERQPGEARKVVMHAAHRLTEERLELSERLRLAFSDEVLEATWGPTETGRQAKFYALTHAGRRQLERELAQWERLSAAVNLVARMA